MSFGPRIESALGAALADAGGPEAPPGLAAALDHAVMPGGARIRPVLLLAVAQACGEDRPALGDAAAAALELIHCASLAHDDLPAFDDAAERRGKPSLHRAFSEPLAVLAGDALILLAFERIARAGTADPARALALTQCLAARAGMPGGICAGQGWESERSVDLETYHRTKTGALFIAATRMGAIVAGHDPEPWDELGARIGAAFQLADDLRDAAEPSAAFGKPVGQDAAHGRPNAVAAHGLAGARERLRAALAAAIASIPACPGEAALAGLVTRYAERLAPQPASAEPGAGRG